MSIDLKNKKVGVWGLGVVGTSAVSYLASKECSIEVLESRDLNTNECTFLANNQAKPVDHDDISDFLHNNDNIIPSPGIDLRHYKKYQNKWLSELDLFADEWHKPIIAITGTAGKTTVTSLLSQLLTYHGASIATGGNIGTGMLDLLKVGADLALLEVSSFQLELCKTFAPKLAIWTNFTENHLDRHDTIDEYFTAKCNIFANQHNGDKALLPLSIAPRIHAPDKTIYFFSPTRPTESELVHARPAAGVFYLDGDTIIFMRRNTISTIFNLKNVPAITFNENWLVICAALHLLKKPLDIITQCSNQLTMPEHRLEKVATINDVTFYNDSKSTTPQSTTAAIQQLKDAPIKLFLGGISKGINRRPLIELIKNDVSHIYCFGTEARQLQRMCVDFDISSSCSSTLERSFTLCTQRMQPGDTVLFSPAGASFDLFKNYKERGAVFKTLVHQLK